MFNKELHKRKRKKVSVEILRAILKNSSTATLSGLHVIEFNYIYLP